MKSSVALLTLAGIGACSQAPRPPNPEVVTLFDAKRLVVEQGPVYRVATDAGLPGGVSLGRMLVPTEATRLQSDATRTAEYAATYATTEVWSHFDRLWVQPMYVLVTSWDQGKPAVVPPDSGGPRSWIFGVGPQSGFYSPFWQMVYVDVPDEPTARTLTSARQIIEGGYKLHPGPGRMAALTPDDLEAPADSVVARGQGWLDGKPVSFFDFGGGTFEWDADGVIKELPIYVFLMRNAQGDWVAPNNIPTVAGVAPAYSGVGPGQMPPSVGGQTRWASYWRVYTVRLPPAARIVAPLDGDRFLYDSLVADGVAVADAINSNVYKIADRVGEAVLNPAGAGLDGGIGSCFAEGDGTGCIFLDSQFAIEANVDPSMVRRTDVTVTCPFVTLGDVPVRPLL